MKKQYIKYCIVLIPLLLLAEGCNPERHYKTLSLFFDGVPKLETMSKTNQDSILSKADSLNVLRGEMLPEVAKRTVSVHPVYQPNKCDQCHDVNHSYRLNQRQPELCYHCHQDFRQKYAKLHGPVAAGYCTACHTPHQSEFKHLLKHPPRENCQYCHHAGDVAKNSAHEDISEVECMECHNPHGGEDKYFLK